MRISYLSLNNKKMFNQMSSKIVGMAQGGAVPYKELEGDQSLQGKFGVDSSL